MADRICKFDSSGRLVADLTRLLAHGGGSQGPESLAVSPAGVVYMVGTGIRRLRPKGFQWIPIPGLSLPRDIAIGRDGCLYAIAFKEDAPVWSTRDMKSVRTWRRSGSRGEHTLPCCIAVGKGGDVYLSEGMLTDGRGVCRSERLERYSADGVLRSICLIKASGSPAYFMDMATGPDGDVYVLRSDSKIARFTFDLMPRGTFGGEGLTKGLFRMPRSIAIDGRGSVYVGDSLDMRIQKFTAEGRFVTQWRMH